MIKKSEGGLKDFNLTDENGIDQPTKERIEALCNHLNLPFSKEIAAALLYGDNTERPEKILPEWLKKLN